MKTKLTLLLLLLFTVPQVSFSSLKNFDALHEYYHKQLRIQEGSFLGGGLVTEGEYQLTLLQYSPFTPQTFVVILEKFDDDHNLKHSRAYLSKPITETQTDFFEFLLDKEKTIILPPVEGQAQITLNLHKIEDGEMMLELKPLQEDPVFKEVIRFYQGRTPHVYRSLEHPNFKKDKDELLVRTDKEGSWAELVLSNHPQAGGTFQISDEGIPGLFVMKRVIKDRYNQEISEEISYVVYFSRRVTNRGLLTGPLWLGKTADRFVTTLPTLSEGVWELERD